MDCNLEQSDQKTVLCITGTMTIEDAANLKTTLSGAIAAASLIEVDLGGCDETDLSCLQVLCSAHRAAAQGGKTFVLQNVGDSLITCLDDAGFLRQSGCLLQDGEPCLWQEESIPDHTTGR